MQLSSTREVVKIKKGRRTWDGAGVQLIRVFSQNDVYDTDPFLMLDAFDSTIEADYIKGFPLHPHRGIETLTYLIEGQIDHQDSLGNKGSIHSGELQWMTAGKGILHEEMPQPSKQMYGLQLWINLPQKQKMVSPHYFDIKPNMVGVKELPRGTVKVIAGEYDGVKGVEPKYVHASVFDVNLLAKAEIEIPTPANDTVILYILEGAGMIHQKVISERSAIILGEGESMVIKALDVGIRFMVFMGTPLHEPIAWGGPVVMNTEEELEHAFQQLREGTFIES